MKAYLTIDAGGTFLKSAVFDADGHLFADSFCSKRSMSDGTKNDILQAYSGIIKHGCDFVVSKNISIAGLGIATPGPFDIVKTMPLMQHKFKSIYGLNMRHTLREISGLPNDVKISFMHDANAMLAGELWKGNATGYKNAAVVALGTGLGFAVSHRGNIQLNDIGGPGISIFKIPYKNGILEDYASQRGILKLYHEQRGQENIDGIEVCDIAQLAFDGDQTCASTFEKVGGILAKTLKPILENNKIECLLFGGQISKSFSLMREAFKKNVGDMAHLTKIDVVKNIEHASLLGALQNVL